MRPAFPVITLDDARQMASDLRRTRLMNKGAPPMTPAEIMEIAVSALIRLDDELTRVIAQRDEQEANIRDMGLALAQMRDAMASIQAGDEVLVVETIERTQAEIYEPSLVSDDPDPYQQGMDLLAAAHCDHSEAVVTPDGWQCPCGAGEQRLFDVRFSGPAGVDLGAVGRMLAGEINDVLPDAERAADARREAALRMIRGEQPPGCGPVVCPPVIEISTESDGPDDTGLAPQRG